MQYQVKLKGQDFTYDTDWDGQTVLAGNIIAFDCETVAHDIPEPQVLVLSAVSNGKTSFFIKNSELANFILLHKDKHFVFQNIPFDFWVVDKYLRQNHQQEALASWYDIVENVRAHDTMLLDMLYQLALRDAYPVPRNLGVLGKIYAGIELDKEDPYRIRYGEILGLDLNKVDPGFREYAIKDPITTYYTFVELYTRCKNLARQCGIHKDNINKWGMFTESIQIKGAIALSKVYHNGIRIDMAKKEESYKELERKVKEAYDQLNSNPRYRTVFKVHRRTGVQLLTDSGMPSISMKVLKEILFNEAQRIENDTNTKVKIPITDKGIELRSTEMKYVGTSMKDWADYKDQSEFIRLYTDMQESAKLCQFFKALNQGVVHPKYTYFVRTGRISAYDFNITQMPKKGHVRDIFVAGDDELLLAVDYKFIELRTLAAVLEKMYGKSVMADNIKAGQDLHIYTASRICNMSYEEFKALKKTDEAKFDDGRQKAKVINFGYPGGLGIDSFITYANMLYKLKFSQEQSKAFRDLYLETYPEMKEYLSEDPAAILSRKLYCSVGKIWDKFDWTGEKNYGIIMAIRNITKGNTTKKDGTPYNENFVKKVWDGLIDLCNNEGIIGALRSRVGGDELYKMLWWDRTYTLTGRIRGQVSFSQGKNTPFQGLAADGAKLALWKLTREGYKIRAFVHDEILVEMGAVGGGLKVEEVKRITNIMEEEMSRVCGAVPIETDYVVGKRWQKGGKIRIEGDRVYPVG